MKPSPLSLPLFDKSPLPAVTVPGLRAYQQEGIDKLRAHVIAGKKRMLLVAPTASGKMFMIANIFRTSTVPCLFVAHRQELIEQCANELRRQGLTRVGIIRGDDDRVDPEASIQVASIQTLARRDKPVAGIVAVDECHRGASDSYQTHVFKHYADSIIIGFTASPSRLDGKPLGGDLFETIDVIVTYQQLLKDGWLPEPEIYTLPVDYDLESVKIKGSDYDPEQLAATVNKRELNGRVVDHWIRLADKHPVMLGINERKRPYEYVIGPRRSTMLFAVDIAHSKSFRDQFADRGVRVAHLDGETPDGERKEILRALAEGEIEIVCNVNVGTEGIDIPRVKMIVHARPSKSLVFWMQTCGRSMRLWPSAIDCTVPLIVDHAGLFEEHGGPHEDRHWSLNSRPSRMSAQIRLKVCRRCFACVAPALYLCPHCGYEFPQAEMRQYTESPEELQRRSVEPEAMKEAFYSKMVSLARTRGYKPGFAGVKYKERYGDWPPRAWSNATSASFASDLTWQQAIEIRLSLKEKIQKDPEMEVGDDPAKLGNVGPEIGDEEFFLDWYERQ